MANEVSTLVPMSTSELCAGGPNNDPIRWFICSLHFDENYAQGGYDIAALFPGYTIEGVLFMGPAFVDEAAHLAYIPSYIHSAQKIMLYKSTEVANADTILEISDGALADPLKLTCLVIATET